MITQLQVFRAGGVVPVVAGEKLVLKAGDVLRVAVSAFYQGKKGDFTLYGSIGTRHALEFDEILVGRGILSCPESLYTPTLVNGSVDIEIVGAGMLGMGGISEGTDYDLYVKIEEIPSVSDEVDDCIDIAALPSIWDMIGPLLVIGLMMGIMSMITPMLKEGFS